MSRLCPTLWDPMDCSPPCSSVHGIFQARNIGVGCHFLLQGIFPTQGSNLHLLCLLCWLVDSSPLTSLCTNRNRPSSGWLCPQRQWLAACPMSPTISLQRTLLRQLLCSHGDLILIFQGSVDGRTGAWDSPLPGKTSSPVVSLGNLRLLTFPSKKQLKDQGLIKY